MGHVLYRKRFKKKVMHLVNNIIMCHLPLVDICEVFGLYKKKVKTLKQSLYKSRQALRILGG